MEVQKRTVDLESGESTAHASRSSSLLGLALSLRDSSTAFLKAAVWATIVNSVMMIVGFGWVDGILFVGETFVGEDSRMKREGEWDEDR